MEKAEICSICYNQIELEGNVDSCRHSFCFLCILKWSEVIFKQTENTCPICKARFFTITKIPKRKYYSRSQRKQKKVLNVNQKNQSQSIDFISLLQAAERILTHELHRLFELS